MKQSEAKVVYQTVIDDILAVYNNTGKATDRVHVNQSVADALWHAYIST